MSGDRVYPKYRTYEDSRKAPSLLTHDFPLPTFTEDEIYYPDNTLLANHFQSPEESRRFGAAMFCGFLEDTIEVEHNLVIPAVAVLRRLPYGIPPQPLQDLYATATDEGFHAEQSLRFTSHLRAHFDLDHAEEHKTPLFLRRLELQRMNEPNEDYRNLITVLNGVITETRISLELGSFARDRSLASAVREVCKTHADDEAIHASQFRALGRWLWEGFDGRTRVDAAKFITASTIARSLPDVERIAFFFHQATGRSQVEAQRLIYSVYTQNVSIDELLFAARPTVSFITNLGVTEYVSFSAAIEKERQHLAEQLTRRREELERS